jgi:hypothetical protein
MNKQTAVEWLIEQYENGIHTIQVDEIAKLMEKEQIENAYFEGADACDVELEGERYFLVKPCSLSGGALYYALTYGI